MANLGRSATGDQESSSHCPFCAILSGEESEALIAKDEEKRLALVKSIHPESSVHWRAVPYEHITTTEELEGSIQERFSELVNFAVEKTKALATDNPVLGSGFTLKMHIGTYETTPHAKPHVMSVE